MPLPLYLDENVARSVAEGLRRRGIDVVRIQEIGLRGADDLTHIRRARADGRVILTHDDDFLRLHAQGEPHAGIIYAPLGTDPGRLVRYALLVAEVLTADEMVNHIEFVT